MNFMAKDISAAIQAAIVKHQAGDFLAAEQMYLGILSQVPNDAGIVNLLGVALFQQNKLPEADEKVRHAIELNPVEAAFHCNLGNIAKALGKNGQAEVSYRNALKLRYYFPEATQNLCNLLESQGRFEASAQLCRDAIQFSPRDIKVHNKLFGLYDKHGDWTDAVVYYQKIVELQPDNWEARFFYARALQKNNQAGLAIVQYQLIVQYNPQHAYAHFHLSRLLAARGDMSEALRHAKTAAGLAPQFGNAQLDYASLLLIGGQYDATASAGCTHSGENSRVEQAEREILSDHYANVACFEGWLFTVLIDHLYFDSRIIRQPVQRRVTHWQTCAESSDVVQAANEHLERVGKILDIAAQYAALENLTLLDTPSLTLDSFAGLTDVECQQAIGQFFSGGQLNLVIIGAGPVGLALASAVKLALRADVNVLVVENRVSSTHHKLPYDRRWVTNLPRKLFQGLVEAGLSDIFTHIGKGAYIGCTINVLETLLLLSCRRMGVKFLFAENGDLAFIQDSPVQFVFDASGNRFQPKPWPESPEQITVLHNIDTDWLGINDVKIAPYGIKIHPCADNRCITLGGYNELIVPLYKNMPVKLAMLKLTLIPIRFYEELAGYITQHNADNKYYVWPGTLQAAINQAIVIINLDKAEYDYLCGNHVFPLKLPEALQTKEFSASVDARTVFILKFMAEHASEPELEQIGIEAPFLFEPYLVNRATPERLHGKPLLRVGDSIYNGNLKRGNGLGCHLQHVRFIQTVLLKYVRNHELSAATGAAR